MGETMATVTQLVTAQEFMTMDLGEGLHELVEGEVVDVPLPTPDHGRISFRSGFLLEIYGQRTGLGYVVGNDSAILTGREPDSVRGADVAFYLSATCPRESLKAKPLDVQPALAIEVASPGNRQGDMLDKVSEYLRSGIANVWVIYPAKRLLIAYRQDDVPTNYYESDPVENVPELPGFRCVVADFFV